MSSSPNSRSISSPALISGAENRNAPEDDAFKKKNIPAAVLLEGRFTSLFSNRLARATMDTLFKMGTPFQSRNIGENKMIVISDGDIALNGLVRNNPIPMGVNTYTVGTQYEYQFSNRVFIENCLEYLVNNNGLSEAKSKDYKLRLLDPKRIGEDRFQWQIINIIAPIILILLCGAAYQWWRKNKFRN